MCSRRRMCSSRSTTISARPGRTWQASSRNLIRKEHQMNDRARDLLVAASLTGTPQIKGALRMGSARCAIGVLCDDLVARGLWSWDFQTPFGPAGLGIQLYRVNDIAEHEWYRIVEANNGGWDFLT